MPKVDYTNGIIYRIKNKYTNECYVGSSATTINKRFKEHKYDYKKYELQHNWISSFYLFLKYGVENCYIELIKKFPCNSKNELEREEGIFTLREPNRVNMKIAGRTRKEYREDNADIIKAYRAKYYEDNPDKVKASTQKYREDNPDKVKASKQKYREANKDKIKADNAKYREANKDKVKAYQKAYRQLKKNKQ